MSYKDKVVENKRVAEKCLDMKAYNAGVTRAYYAAFQHIKGCLEGGNFDYGKFLLKSGKKDERHFSHGTIQYAAVTFLASIGKKPADIMRLSVLDNMYGSRRKADYDERGVGEIDLKDSLRDLNAILSVVG